MTRQRLTFLYRDRCHGGPLPPLDVMVGRPLWVLQVEPLESPVPAAPRTTAPEARRTRQGATG